MVSEVRPWLSLPRAQVPLPLAQVSVLAQVQVQREHSEVLPAVPLPVVLSLVLQFGWMTTRPRRKWRVSLGARHPKWGVVRLLVLPSLGVEVLARARGRV